MPAARFWRALQMMPCDGGAAIELSEFQLLAGTARVDLLATLSASSGANVAVLADGAASAAVAFPADTVLTWDFGDAPQDVTDIRLGACDQPQHFPFSLQLQWSVDGTAWTSLYDAAFDALAWPGPWSLTASVARSAKLIAGSFYRDWQTGSMTGQTLYSAGSASMTVGLGGLLLTSPFDTDSKVRFADMPSQRDVDIALIVARPVNANVGVVIRTSNWSASDGSYAYLVGLWTDSVFLARGGNGTGSPGVILASASVSLPEQVVMRVVAVGSAFRVYINDVLVISVTDATYAAPGEVGLRAYCPSVAGCFLAVKMRPLETRSLIAVSPVSSRTRIATAKVAAAAATPPAFRLMASPVRMARDAEFGGVGRIFGTTKTKASPSNLPTKARVVLLHQRSKVLVRATWSDPDTGDYSFDGLDLRQEFCALAEDAAGNFRAVAAQRLLPGTTP